MSRKNILVSCSHRHHKSVRHRPKEPDYFVRQAERLNKELGGRIGNGQ